MTYLLVITASIWETTQLPDAGNLYMMALGFPSAVTPQLRVQHRSLNFPITALNHIQPRDIQSFTPLLLLLSFQGHGGLHLH